MICSQYLHFHKKPITNRCNICGTELADQEHLERHKEVHKRHKAKPVEFGDPYFMYPIWSAQNETFVPFFAWLFGKDDESTRRHHKH